MDSLSAREILRIHDVIIASIGGSSGLREPGLLEAISEKPHASFGGEELYPTIYDKAAAIFEALCNYHVFVDGNKRTAIISLEYYLYLNGQQLLNTNPEKEAFILKTATTHPDLAEVAAWIKTHAQPEPTK